MSSVRRRAAGQGQVLQRVRDSAFSRFGPAGSHSARCAPLSRPTAAWSPSSSPTSPASPLSREKLDPEAVRDLITACFDRLVPCIQRYGGTIDKFIGDEMMALFGAPAGPRERPRAGSARRPRDARRPSRLSTGSAASPWASTSG